MEVTCVLITGFGPFSGVELNPSGELARALAADPPGGVLVRSRVLPVTFEGAPSAWDELLEEPGPAPGLLLSLGVHPGSSFRLERRARGVICSERADNAGVVAQELQLEDGQERVTGLALEPLADLLRAAGAREVELSEDAGGYVCERTFHHLLVRAEERAVPGLFIHVPPVATVSLQEQLGVLRTFLPALVRLPQAYGLKRPVPRT